MAKYFTSTRFRPECPTCGNKIGQLEESYKRLLEQGKTPHDALEALGIERPCCRVRALWPIVMPLGGFYLPHGEASMLNYLGIKEPTPQPNLVVMSLRRAANSEDFLVSHVDSNGFIGVRHEPTELVIAESGEGRKTHMQVISGLPRECEVRIQTEPGEITRGFPYETRAFRRDIQVDRVKSYFDLELEETEDAEASRIVEYEGGAPLLPDGEEDEPLIVPE